MAALDDRRAQLLLELPDRRRQRRLRDVAGFRRAAEMPLARQRHEIFELADHHRRDTSRARAAVHGWRQPHGGLWRPPVRQGAPCRKPARSPFRRASPLSIAGVALVAAAFAAYLTPSRSGQPLIGGPFALQTGGRQDGHRQGPARPSVSGLFRLHPLPRRLPDDARANLRRARQAAGQTGQGAVRHRRSRARHAEADGRLCLQLRPPHHRPFRLAGADRASREGLSRLRAARRPARTATTRWTIPRSSI